MADIYTAKKRSQIMSRIRSTGTKPEERLLQLVRQVLRRRKIVPHTRVHGVRVDAYVPGLKAAIFCDGCFYHQCPRHGHIPKSNVGYWAPKLRRNSRRDNAYRRRLRAHGIAAWRFWEHDLRKSCIDRALRRLGRLVVARESIICKNHARAGAKAARSGRRLPLRHSPASYKAAPVRKSRPRRAS